MRDHAASGLLAKASLGHQLFRETLTADWVSLARARPLRLLIVALAPLLAHQAARATDQGLQVTDTTVFDQLDSANQDPGHSDVSMPDGSRVSFFNGNLMISQGVSNILPQNGNLPPVFLGLTYNSDRVRKYHARTGASTYGDYLSGRTWVGLGWTGHLGRIFTRSKYLEASGVYYSRTERYFEFPDGSLYRFEASVIPAAPDLRILYFEDCTGTPDPTHCPPCNICSSNPDAPCCRCGGTSECAGRSSDPTEHYEVTFPDGTIYRLERIVAETSVGSWIKNDDRNGFYTTQIKDVFGNTIAGEGTLETLGAPTQISES